jgi:hypothetical protein
VPDGGAWMRYESKAGLGPPMRRNDHASKALAYLLAGPYGQQAFDMALDKFESVSYVGDSIYTSRHRVDSADYIRRTSGR